MNKKSIISLNIIRCFIFGSFFVLSWPVLAIGDNQIKSVVQIICPTSLGYSVGGSGTIIREDGIILTNKHVIEDASGLCQIGITTSSINAPSFLYTAEIIAVANSFDIAILAIKEKKSGFPYIDTSDISRNPILGEEIEVLGYPGIGGSTLTFTKGYVVGQENIQNEYTGTPYWYTKTDALIAHGNSGGSSYYKNGEFAGIPTAVKKDDITAIGYITPAILVWNFIKYNYTTINGIPNQGSSITKPVPPNPSNNYYNNPPSTPCCRNVYTDSSKSSIVIDSGGTSSNIDYPLTIHSDATPTFEWSEGYHITGIDGYYIYFGKNKNANPITDGFYSSFDPQKLHQGEGYAAPVGEYSPPRLTENGVYYLIIAVKAKNGLVSSGYSVFPYTYNISLAEKSIETTLHDGDLIRSKGSTDVYIIKYINNKKYKRLILSPTVFNSYGHLRWQNIIDVTQDTMESFKTSNLVRATVAGDPKVYLLYPEPTNSQGGGGDTGIKRWITNEQIFRSLGLDWDEIYTINETDRNSYKEVEALSQ